MARSSKHGKENEHNINCISIGRNTHTDCSKSLNETFSLWFRSKLLSSLYYAARNLFKQYTYSEKF